MCQRLDQVMVIGQVYNQSAFVYRKKLDRDDYIDLAGGATRYADTSHIYVMRANGIVQAGIIWGRGRRIEPGYSIVVPEDLDNFNLLDSMLDCSKVVFQMGTGVASMRALGMI